MFVLILATCSLDDEAGKILILSTSKDESILNELKDELNSQRKVIDNMNVPIKQKTKELNKLFKQKIKDWDNKNIKHYRDMFELAIQVLKSPNHFE